MYRVMIVEDEYLVAKWLKQKINWDKFGLEVVAQASDGLRGFELYSELRPDIVMTDLRMPVMDGISMIGKIRDLSADTRILILTCLDEFEMARRAIEYDVTSYIMKLQFEIPDIENELMKAISWLNEHISRDGTAKSGQERLCGEKGIPYKLTKVLRYMQNHYTENISICDAAQYINVSANYLGKLFAHHELGKFTEVLNTIRVRKAKNLLLHSNCHIYEIAEKTGFMNANYFIRVFHRMEGITPGEYRNQKI